MFDRMLRWESAAGRARTGGEQHSGRVVGRDLTVLAASGEGNQFVRRGHRLAQILEPDRSDVGLERRHGVAEPGLLHEHERR